MPPKQDSIEMMVVRIDEKTDNLISASLLTNSRLKELNGTVADSCTKIKVLENKAKDNRSLIVSLWSIYVLTGGAWVTNLIGVWGR
jgi:hypothetical protein